MALIKSTQPNWDVRTLNLDEGVGLISGFSSPLVELNPADITRFGAMDYEELRQSPGIIGLETVR